VFTVGFGTHSQRAAARARPDRDDRCVANAITSGAPDGSVNPIVRASSEGTASSWQEPDRPLLVPPRVRDFTGWVSPVTGPAATDDVETGRAKRSLCKQLFETVLVGAKGRGA
jgi:hypothetical protein